MSIIDDRCDKYTIILYGEEFLLSESAKVFSECWIYKKTVSIGKNTLLIIDIEKSCSQYKSIIITKDHGPIVTKESTTEIIHRYQKKNQRNYKFSKRIVKSVFSKKSYLHAYIEKGILFVPLEGESSGNVSYINLTYVDAVSAHSDYESVISFSNYLDVIVPISTSCLRKRVVTYLKHYIACLYCLKMTSEKEEAFDPFKDWFGRCHEEHTDLTLDVIKRIDRNKINVCRTINDFEHYLSAFQKEEVMENYYEGTL